MENKLLILEKCIVFENIIIPYEYVISVQQIKEKGKFVLKLNLQMPFKESRNYNVIKCELAEKDISHLIKEIERRRSLFEDKAYGNSYVEYEEED